MWLHQPTTSKKKCIQFTVHVSKHKKHKGLVAIHDCFQPILVGEREKNGRDYHLTWSHIHVASLVHPCVRVHEWNDNFIATCKILTAGQTTKVSTLAISTQRGGNKYHYIVFVPTQREELCNKSNNSTRHLALKFNLHVE